MITFALAGQEFMVEPMKVDRKKVYGWSEVHAFDDEGNECVLVSTDASGTIIIPKGGVALGVTSPDGKWVERNQLRTITADGQDATMTRSSYNGVNDLTRQATDEEFLDCSITAIYHLKDAEATMVAAIGDDIYRFDYCYLDSYETSPAFILSSEIDGKKELFMFVGKQNQFTYIGLDEFAIALDTESEDDEDDSGDIDFSMF